MCASFILFRFIRRAAPAGEAVFGGDASSCFVVREKEIKSVKSN